MPRTLIAAIAAGLMLAVPAHAEDGDANRGRSFAEQLCSGCHAIEKNETSSPFAAAPPFSALVAQTENWTGESFANWLGTAHPAINGVAVKPAVASDLLSYIRSLAPPKEQAARAR